MFSWRWESSCKTKQNKKTLQFYWLYLRQNMQKNDNNATQTAAALTGIYRIDLTTCSWIRAVTGETSHQQILTSYSRRSSSPLVFLRHFLVEGLSLSFVPPAEIQSSVNKLEMQVMLKRNSVQTESTRQATFYTSFGNCLVKLATRENKVHRVEEQLHLLEPDQGPTLHREAA